MTVLDESNSGKIRIIYIINNLSTGGAQMMLYRLLSRLDRAVFDVQVITLISDNGLIRDKIENIGITVQVVGFKSKLNPLPIIRMYRLIKSAKPDIVHTQLFAADILGRFICRLIKVPVVITSIRNTYYGGKLRDFMIKLTEKYATRTTIVSKAAAKRFIDHKIIPAEKLQVIYNGIDTELSYPNLKPAEKKHIRAILGLPYDELLILAVGRMTEQKGYIYLLEAFKMLTEKIDNVKLLVAGTGKEEVMLEEKAANLGLRDKIIFLGRFDEMAQLMASADLLVSSSLWEGLPGVIMEAMAAQLPVVATAVGGTPELVVNESTGYLVSPGSAPDLAEAMEKVSLLSDEKRKAMGSAGRKIIEEQYRIELMVEAYEKLYLETYKNVRSF